MKQPLTHSLPAKVAGLFLMVLLFLLAALSGAGVFGGLYFGIYDEGATAYYDTDQCHSEILSDLHNVYCMLEEGATGLSDHSYYGDFDECNLRFAGYCFRTGRFLSNDSQMQAALRQIAAARYTSPDYQKALENSDALVDPSFIADLAQVTPNAEPQVSRSEDGRLLGTVIQWDINDTWFIAGVVSPLSARDAYFRQDRLFNLVYALRVAAPILLVVCVFAIMADLIFLCCAAGHRRGREDIVSNLQDRIPLDLYLFAMFWAGFFCLFLMAELTSFSLAHIVFAALLAVCFLLLCLATLLTLATRFKLGKWWRNTVIWWCGSLFIRFCRAVGRGVRGFFRLFPLVWRAVALACALLFGQTMLTLLMFNTYNPGLWFLVTVAADGLLVLAVMALSRHLQQLREAGAALASGDFDRKIDTSRMRGSLREHGQDLNSLGCGLSIAVEQKMRSERLKTELITNVSHDIKTPLTSIINYVDLLQKNPSPEEQSAYLEVLDRQAKRLKKLTEDLVEASKASTGNLACHLAPTNLREILDQSLGEYEDRLKAAGLEPVVTLSEDDISVIADGRLLWRVLDNLLNNACKYAQSGTRLYLDVRVWEDRAVLAVKNISRQQLNLSPDELMERFVRGDSSRNTEGSGLGLNIAKSLVELQNGSFSLAIDGDLFKATIALPRSLSTPEI